MSLPSGVTKRPKEAAVHVAMAHARKEARMVVARTEDARPSGSVDNARIIPAVTAAVTNTTFVMSDTIGQMPLASRVFQFDLAREHSTSLMVPDAGGSPSFDSATSPGETAHEGFGDATLER
eukprot:5855850-Pleurochrysis_carterae.AAC.1